MQASGAVCVYYLFIVYYVLINPFRVDSLCICGCGPLVQALCGVRAHASYRSSSGCAYKLEGLHLGMRRLMG